MGSGTSPLGKGSGGTNNAQAPNTQQQSAQTPQPKYSTGSGDTYQLGRVEEATLKDGNTYEFATQLLKAYPDFCQQQNFTSSKAVNSYKAYTEFNDGIFTFRGKAPNGTPTKYFFDTKMKRRGAKQ